MVRITQLMPSCWVSGAVALLVVGGSCAVSTAQDCLDYSDYWHEVGSADTGWSHALTVVEDVGYIGSGSELMVIDLADESFPDIVHTQDLSWLINDIVVEGDLAYAAISASGLLILDVSDPFNPVPVGHVPNPGLAHGVAVADGYAYVADHSEGLMVVDVADPAQPMAVGSLDTPGSAYQVVVEDGFAYVADHTGGLHVIDVHEPSSPALVSSLETPGKPVDLVKRGHHLFIADYSSGLAVVDVSDPAVPAIVSTIEHNFIRGARDIALSEDLAFLVLGSQGLVAIDIAEPTDPQMVATMPNEDADSRDVAVRGNSVFVLAPNFKVLDISHHLAPPVVASVPITSVGGLTLANDHAYVTSAPYYNGTLEILDLADPDNPVLVGAVADTLGRPSCVAVAGEMAYVGDTWGALWTVDVADPTDPVRMGVVTLPGAVLDVEVSDSYAFVACSEAGVQVVDVTDPANPQVVILISSYGLAGGVAVAGNNLFIADDAIGVHQWDITDPRAPILAATMPVPGVPRGITVEGQLAYVPDATGRLWILDLESRSIVGDGRVPGQLRNVTLADGVAYVTGFSTGVQVVDVMDPTAPRHVGSLAGRWSLEAVAYEGNIYTTVWSTSPFLAMGLHVVRPHCADPTEVEDLPLLHSTIHLAQNFPNPFNPSTTIGYDLAQPSTVQLTVFDVTGRVVRRLQTGTWQAAGIHQAVWNGRDERGRGVASGVYFYRLDAGGESSTRRMVLMK